MLQEPKQQGHCHIKKKECITHGDGNLDAHESWQLLVLLRSKDSQVYQKAKRKVNPGEGRRNSGTTYSDTRLQWQAQHHDLGGDDHDEHQLLEAPPWWSQSKLTPRGGGKAQGVNVILHYAREGETYCVWRRSTKVCSSSLPQEYGDRAPRGVAHLQSKNMETERHSVELISIAKTWSWGQRTYTT